LLSERKSHQAQQTANSLPLAREHSPDVNDKPISIPHLEQEILGNFQAAQSLSASFPWAVMNSSLP